MSVGAEPPYLQEPGAEAGFWCNADRTEGKQAPSLGLLRHVTQEEPGQGMCLDSRYQGEACTGPSCICASPATAVRPPPHPANPWPGVAVGTSSSGPRCPSVLVMQCRDCVVP